MEEEKRAKDGEKETEQVFYVDRDRAAAVVIGNKDIKSDLKVLN